MVNMKPIGGISFYHIIDKLNKSLELQVSETEFCKALLPELVGNKSKNSPHGFLTYIVENPSQPGTWGYVMESILRVWSKYKTDTDLSRCSKRLFRLISNMYDNYLATSPVRGSGIFNYYEQFCTLLAKVLKGVFDKSNPILELCAKYLTAIVYFTYIYNERIDMDDKLQQIIIMSDKVDFIDNIGNYLKSINFIY